MSWRIFQRWFNLAPWPGAKYILDRHGEKFWISLNDKAKNRAKFYVIHRGQQVGHVFIHKNGEKSLELADIFVEAQYRSRGVGKRLMQLALQWAKDHGYQSIEGFMANHDGLSEEDVAEWYRGQGFQVNDGVIFREIKTS